MIPLDLNLKQRRLDANLSQTALAKRLGVTQSQVLRYEAEPDNVPARVLREWLSACGEMQATRGLDVGTPYAGLPEGLASLALYARNQPALDESDTVRPAIGIEDLITALGERGRKPRLLLCGRYDAGKSRLANALMGADRLPASYQPATRIVCLVRHLADKPAWQREDVWIMGEGFDLNRVEEEKHCEDHRLVAGDFETLARFGTHKGRRDAALGEPVAALVYVDAPILHACDLIDTPGLSHDERDNALASAVFARGDVLVYLSPLTGFMNGEDLRALGTLIEALPSKDGEAPLRALAVLATHAHIGVTDAEVAGALDAGAARTARELAPLIDRRVETTGEAIDEVALRARFFPWYVESAPRRDAFERDTRELLGQTIPIFVQSQLDHTVTAFQTQADEAYGREAEHLRALLQEREHAEEQLRAMQAAEPERRRRLQEQQRRIEAHITQAKTQTRLFIEETIRPMLSEDRLQELIEGRYDESKLAEQHAANAVLVDIRAEVERIIAVRAETLAADVEAFLGEYGRPTDVSVGPIDVPFDARAAFIGALAAGGAFGALSTWAAVAAGGSNLGAYILVPQVVGLLARLGIGIAGGTATGVSLVSALGGPVGIGIGIALTIGLFAWEVFGRSWQSRLARQISERLLSKEVDVVGKVTEQCDRCWDETLQGFRDAAARTEDDHGKHLARLAAPLNTPRDALEARLKRVEARRAFLSFLPWTPLSKGAAA